MNAARSALLVGLLSLALAGCAGAAGSPSASPVEPTDPPPTQVPGGRESPSPVDPGGIGGIGGGSDPGGGQPQLVQPNPGLTVDAHPVSIETLEPQIDGRRVVVLATWWSGIEPCYLLDTVSVEQDGNAFTIALTEGRGPGDAVCIEIAVQKATSIDLGELEPGNYTVSAQDGTAEPISFTIS